MGLSRRDFVQLAGTGVLLQSRLLKAAESSPASAPVAPDYSAPAKVALVQGDIRRTNVYQALVALDDQIQPDLKRKKYVVIKPNGVSVATIAKAMIATSRIALTRNDFAHTIQCWRVWTTITSFSASNDST